MGKLRLPTRRVFVAFAVLMVLCACSSKQPPGSLEPNQKNSKEHSAGLAVAKSTGWKGKIVVSDGSGKTILELPYAELMKINENAVDGAILGWSSDHRYVWFDTNMDAYTVFFGRIDTVSGKWETFARPQHLRGSEIQIDFDSGQTIYSDFPPQFDTQTAAATKKSGKKFHLYANSLLAPNEIVVDTNEGEGFFLTKSPSGTLQYKKLETDSFREVK